MILTILIFVGYEAAFLNEFSGETFTCPSNSGGAASSGVIVCRFPNGQAVIDFYAFNGPLSSTWIDLAFLTAIIVVGKVLAYIFLLIFKRPKGA